MTTKFTNTTPRTFANSRTMTFAQIDARMSDDERDDDDEDYVAGYATQCYLSAMTRALHDNIREHGFIIDHDARTLTFNDDALTYVEMITKAISDEYDQENVTTNYWDIFNCSGDDDVDYNSGYLTIVIDAIRNDANKDNTQ